MVDITRLYEGGHFTADLTYTDADENGLHGRDVEHCWHRLVDQGGAYCCIHKVIEDALRH